MNLLPGEMGISDLPVTYPLLRAGGALLLLCDDASREAARNILQSILLRAALAMPEEVRFSLIDQAGLGAAFPFRRLLTTVRPTGRTVADELEEVQRDIRRINEDVIEQEESFLSLSREKRAGEAFELIAAVDFPEPYARDPRAIEYLVRLGNSGPRAGRHLLLEVRTDVPLPRDFELDQFQKPVIVDCRSLDFIVDPIPEGTALRRHFEAVNRSRTRSTGGDLEYPRPACEPLFPEFRSAD